ncbi:MAG: cation diffusion facilitator family transporter [Litorimonas sp.]
MTAHSHSHHDHASHGHSHAHGEMGHCHTPKVNESNRWRVGLAALLTGLFMLAEVAGGLISGSLALLADAGHMLTDFAALAMAWGAFRLATRPANSRYNYGYDRVPILVAFVNGLTLFAVSVWIIWEAIQRLIEPGEILAGPMLWIAVAGLIVNLIVFWILLGADQENLNIRGAVLHVIGDLLGSVAAIAAAIIILLTGWVLADPILSVLVAALILKSAWALIKDSGHILLQGAPTGYDNQTIHHDLMDRIDGLKNIESIKVWSVTREHVVVTLEAFTTLSADPETVREAIKARLSEKFSIDDAAIDVRR